MPPEEPPLPLTGSAWLEVHFEAMRAEYERMLRSVGLERGWRVVDAGCGTGPFLPSLRRLVGETGAVLARVVATDRSAAWRPLECDPYRRNGG